MRSFAIVLIALVVLMAGCASPETSARELKGSVSGGVMSKYISALGYQLSEKPVAQTAVAISSGGWEAKAFGFAGFQDSDPAADEVDLALSYKTAIGEWSVSGGVFYFAFDPVLDHDGDVVMPYVELGRDIWKSGDHGLNVSGRIEDRIGRFPDLAHRLDPSVALKYTWQIASGVKFTTQAGCLYDRGVDEFTRGWLPQSRATLSVDLAEDVQLEGFVRFVRPTGFHDDVRGYGQDEAFGAALIFKF